MTEGGLGGKVEALESQVLCGLRWQGVHIQDKVATTETNT